MSEHEMTIGFIGNPNCGKTTLFNAYTGANLKVANWPGVTVEKVEGVMKDHDLTIHLVDLPGTYSLTSYTMEETVSRQFILSDEVDVIINVVDASALERNLYLTLQLLELGKPVVLALNMMDIVEKRGMEIDLHRLPEMLGIPVIPVSARKRRGLDILLHAAAHHKDCTDPDCLIHHHKVCSKHRHNHHSEYTMVYSDEIEDKIDQIMPELKRRYPGLTNYRWHALKLLEEDKEITEKYPVNLPQVLDRSYESDIINQKYDFIGEIIGEVLLHKERQDLLTERADKLLTSKVWSIPIFLGIMAVTFFLTFTIGDWIKGYFELGIDWLSGVAQSGLTAVHAGTILTSLMVDGIIGGVGTIVTFLPNILILFLCLALLEDSGYMARVAYSMYLIGIVVAIVVSAVIHLLDRKKSVNYLMIELPEYKLPDSRTVAIYVWEKVKDYLEKAGTTIFIATLVIWLLLNFGPHGYSPDMAQSFGAMIGKWLVPFFAPIGLGFWQIAVALIAGVSAKEVVVSSCAVLFGIVNASSPEGMSAFASALNGIGFGPLNAFSLMVFCLLYIPCAAALATIRKESGSWIWMGFTALFQLAVAWIVTFGVYQIGSLVLL